jgi:hypothetical protein
VREGNARVGVEEGTQTETEIVQQECLEERGFVERICRRPLRPCKWECHYLRENSARC